MRSTQRRVCAMVGCIFHQWIDLTQRSLTRLEQSWRRQRLVLAFTAWSLTVDDAVGNRIGMRLLYASDHYCHIAGLELNCSGTVPMISNTSDSVKMIYLDDSPATTPMRIQRELPERCAPAEQRLEQHSWIVLSDSDSDSVSDCDSESCASNSSFASCASFVSCTSGVTSARRSAGPRKSLADITNGHGQVGRECRIASQ